MRHKKKLKTVLISCVAVVLVLAMGGGAWYYFAQRNAEPVFVFSFNNVGMTEYWGDTQESYGPVSTDKIQTVFLSDTQTVTQVLVQSGDTVKKGDLLITFDTTLSDLALERQRLEVEKLKLQLEDAKDRLREIRNMVPMVIPKPSEDPTEPPIENLGLPLAGKYQIVSKEQSDGSTQELSLVCWLSSEAGIDDELLEALRVKAQELQELNAATAPTEPDPTGETVPAATGETTEPTSATEEPTEPVKPEVNEYFVIFKVTDRNMSLGQTVTWQGIHVARSAAGRYSFRFFDASGIPDTTVENPNQTPEPPEIDFGSGFTASQIAQMRSEQEKVIKDLEFNIKMKEADYKIMQTEASDGNVYAQIDGQVVSLLTEEEAKSTMQPILKVSGGGGFYINGSVSELSKDTLQTGQEVTVNDWNTGMTHTGTIVSIGDYPVSNDGYSGMGNPNVSYYPFTVFVDGEADLMEGSFVSIQYAAADVSSGIYLENPFLRTENGRSYVYVQGGDGKLEKRYVTTGRALWGSYTEILSGLSETDLIALPYGKNVSEGAPTVEGDISELYNY